MIRGLYNWTMSLAQSRYALWALAAISFAESSFFPIPPDVLLFTMVLASRSQWLKLALICTVASVLGGLFGYAIGLFLYESLGKPLLDFYGYADKFVDFQSHYNDWGAWIVFVFGVTPFPYKVITIASGVTQLDIWTFSISSIASRGLRFFVVAGLLYWLGPPIRQFIERWLGLVFTVFCVMLIGGFIVLKVLL